ncbi:MAG: GNAT family N-acetyltransferase [Chloroflexi bacterium]|nr:GNAT family N-acetyltransferase [Chloroflexota bacterium]
MSEAKQLAQQFLAALAANDIVKFQAVLAEDAGMRIARWDGGEAYRPRARVIQRLVEEWSGWPDPKLETHSVLADGERVAVEFRIQATENNRYVEHNRSAFLVVKDNKVETIDLYCAEPLPSARRKGWIAPATLSDDEINRLFESFQYTFDPREWIPPNSAGHVNRRIGYGGSYDAHPGSNWVGGARWSAAEADARIHEMIAHYRERNVGFSWHVGAYDTPADLAQRLERHGFALAGDQAMMARVGLDNLDDIPINPNIEIEILDGSNESSIEASIEIIAVCFKWTREQVAERRPGFYERLKSPKFREEETSYLARLDGKPVAGAHLALRGGVAYMGGAGTLPEYRGQKIYSTLLRRRLQDAHDRGYHIAAIHAEPMSRRVVKRYRFKEYARFFVYAWMPVMDMAVIKSLVPDE